MRQSPAAEQLKERLREKGAVPELYTFDKFSQPCAVYIKLLFPRLNKQTYATATRDASFCYIGSTNITVAKREYNRVAKLRQLQQLKLPKTEIAIRYWNDSQTYLHYSTILLSQHSEYIDAWAEEHSLIQRWQPKLNYPFVTKELVKKAQFWKLLYSISSDTKQEFEASKELRSGKHDAETVTLLYRLANHMEQPWRSKARARLRKVLQFKNASVPKHNKTRGHWPGNFAATYNVGAGNAFYSSKQRIKRQHQDQFQRLAKSILAMIPDDYIIHNEGHANAHSMIYCPTIYNQAAYNTWMDKQTFRILDKAPEEIKQDMQHNTPKVVAKHYAKLLAYEKPLPYGYILMKKKKRWAKGRTIIAYSNTCIGKLLKIEIHQLFNNNEHLYPERHLKFLNHDLVGFFNSIPQSDILQSIHFLTSQFLDDHNPAITVDPHNKIAPAHSGKSTYSLKSNMVKVQAEHIPAIIQFSFDACAFTAIGEVFQQTCGTSMGNQISPILSTCAIVATEITWLRMYGQFVSSAHLHDKFWIRRYVDNRAIIVDEDELQSNPYIQQLASLHFYKKPVQLEDDACDDFLGFRIHADDRRITYNLHREAWRYRLPQSGGSTKLRLSGYHSRKHLIRTIAYPADVAKKQLQELDDLYSSRVKKCKKQRANAAGNAIILTDIDTDSDAMEYTVRLPHGLPLDMNAPVHSVATDDPVEQECELLLQQRYIPFEVFPWLSTKLNSEFLGASALTRAGRRATAYTVGTYYHAGSIGVRTNTRQRPWTAATLAYMVRACTHTSFSTVFLLRNIHMGTHRDKYNKPGSLNVVIPVSAFRQGHRWIEEDNGPDLSPNGQHRGRNIELKLPGVEFSPFKLHGTCPWKSDRLIISAYTTNRIEDICSEDKRYLQQLGFNLA
ncbi:unnamed protein product [Symbiodinium sp. CCMP2592]|nr:unnamed protein product [Symbiodinium sp. CCMP2592]